MTALLQENGRKSTCSVACPSDPVSAAILPLVAVLRQLAELVNLLTDEQYVQKPVGVVPSSIGGHIRHNLDHVDAFLAGVAGGEIDYDQRQRGTEVETKRRAAIEALHRQERELLAFVELGVASEDQSLRLRIVVAPSLPPIEVETSVGRELSFVLSHTIHHNALIGVMAKLLGVPVPERFGYAPSTIAHLEKQSCAR